MEETRRRGKWEVTAGIQAEGDSDLVKGGGD